MIKIGLASTNDAAGLDNKNVSAFIELAQKNDCEVITVSYTHLDVYKRQAIVNLPPRKMMGIDSDGMLISAVHEEDGHEGLNLLMVDCLLYTSVAFLL